MRPSRSGPRPSKCRERAGLRPDILLTSSEDLEFCSMFLLVVKVEYCRTPFLFGEGVLYWRGPFFTGDNLSLSTNLLVSLKSRYSKCCFDHMGEAGENSSNRTPC
jgi:hypothetical protein